MRESQGGKPWGAVKARAGRVVCRGGIPSAVRRRRAHHRPVSTSPSSTPVGFWRGEAERERTRRDPKDGELCLSRTKPEETLVEVRSDSDVQIDRQTWV